MEFIKFITMKRIQSFAGNPQLCRHLFAVAQILIAVVLAVGFLDSFFDFPGFESVGVGP